METDFDKSIGKKKRGKDQIMQKKGGRQSTGEEENGKKDMQTQ